MSSSIETHVGWPLSPELRSGDRRTPHVRPDGGFNPCPEMAVGRCRANDRPAKRTFNCSPAPSYTDRPCVLSHACNICGLPAEEELGHPEYVAGPLDRCIERSA